MFEKILENQYPRMLTQVCRDPGSPFYGCFDRNWWHYRIRDFASVMLQQGGYTLWQYAKLADYKDEAESLQNLARASAIFWNKRARLRGAFEEYYPWEKGYPPLAFSSLAIAKLVQEGAVGSDLVKHGLEKAARQLQKRFEYQAGNQQVAGLAALAMIRKIFPGLVDEKKYNTLRDRTLSLQHEEGWFTEYDGPDLGYLSVTMDCLWDLYDATGEAVYRDSATRALEFMHAFISRRYRGAGMHNARNTDYIVPYGITRFLSHTDKMMQEKSVEILHLVYENIESREHFFHSIDDRYWVHYVGHSVARAQIQLANYVKKLPELPGKPGGAYTFTGPGYIFRELTPTKKRILVSARKGGILTVYDKEKDYYHDFGWVLSYSGKQYVNHWWSENWTYEETEKSMLVKGSLLPHREKISNPFLHFGLRVVSFIFGSALTRVLRNVLIFKKGTSGIGFERKVDLGSDSIIITDKLTGVPAKAEITRAPRASKRHVASADSYNPEDMKTDIPPEISETLVRKEQTVTIVTTYALR